MSVNASENKVLVGLRELEREGEAYRNLYQSYLQRYQQALQQQSFPIIEARIITSASPPIKPSHPKKIPILMLFLLLGGMVGTVLGFLREFRERGFQSDEQIKKDLGLECLGILPQLPSRLTENPPAQNEGSKEGTHQSPFATHKSTRDSQSGPRYIRPCSGLMSYVLDNPGSGFAETLLAVKLAADVKLAGQSSKIIGVVSCLPSEGKSAFSKNFGSLLAKLDAKTLLIDADLRAPKLSRSTAHTARVGLIEAVMNRRPLEELLWVEESSGLSILPTITHARPSHTSEFLASPGMRSVLTQASSQFDYVLVDLPPLGPVVDARAIASQIDAFVFVVEWRRTARKMVRNILFNEAAIYQKVHGRCSEQSEHRRSQALRKLWLPVLSLQRLRQELLHRARKACEGVQIHFWFTQKWREKRAHHRNRFSEFRCKNPTVSIFPRNKSVSNTLKTRCFS